MAAQRIRLSCHGRARLGRGALPASIARMSFVRRAALFLFVIGLSSPALADTPKKVEVIDRIVAVVDRDIVTLVELRKRAAPRLLDLKASVPEAQRVAAEAVMYRDLLQHMIEERILLRYAQRERISISTDEINTAIENVAKANNVKPEAIYEQASAQGMDRAAYRDEIARQILRLKISRAITPSRVFEENRGKPEAELMKAIDAAFQTFIEEQKRETHVEVRL